MGLNDLWRGLWGHKDDPAATTETGPKTDSVKYWSNQWVRSYVRKAVWNELEKMDKDESIIARGLDILTRFSITFSDNVWDDDNALGFRIESPNQQELDLLAPIARTLQEDSYERVRYMVKFGDGFNEVVADPSTGDIVRHKMFPYAYQVERNEDRFGNLLVGDPNEAMRLKQQGLAAYDQVSDYGQLLAAFWPYQVTQQSFGPKQGLRYAEPLLGPIISVCKRLRSAEDGLSIARLCRAWPTKIVPVPMREGIEPKEAAERLKEAEEMLGVEVTAPYDTDTGEFYLKSSRTPEQVDTTLFYPLFYMDDGKVIDAEIKNLPADNPNLNNIEDVYLMIRRVLCCLTVPADFLNLSVGQRSFVDKMNPEKREAFLYNVCAIQRADKKVIQMVCDLQLLLHGRNPLKAKYRIVQPRINPREAETSANIDVKRANTAAIWAKLGIPSEVIGSRILQMHPADVEKWVQSAGEIAPANTTPEKQVAAWQRGTEIQLYGNA